MATQDFTDAAWVEYDLNDRLTKAADRVTWVGLQRQEIARVAKDFGEDYFSGLFVHDFTLYVSSLSSGFYGCVWVMANTLGSTFDMNLAGDPFLAVMLSMKWGTHISLTLWEDGGIYKYLTLAWSTYANTPLYCRVIRDTSVGANGHAYLTVYSDEARTVQIGSADGDLTAMTPFRYLYVIQGFHDGKFTYSSGGYHEDLDIDVAGTPTVTTQAVTVILETTATGNGNVTSLGLGAVTQHGMCYSTLTNLPTIASPHTEEGAAATTGAFTSSMTGLLRNTRYYARAYATNVFGTTYGDAVELSTDPSGIVQMAFGESIFTESPTWTNLAADALSIGIKRGRMHDLDRVETGTATIVLNNSDGNYWRGNTDGDYTPNVKPLTLVRISVKWAGNTYRRFYGVVESFRHGWLDDRGGKLPIVTVSCVDIFKSFSRLVLLGLTGAVGAYTDVAAITNDGASGDSGQKTVRIKSLAISATEGSDIALLHAGQSVTIGDDDASETNVIASIDADTYILTMTTNLAHSYTTAANGYVKKFPSALAGVRVNDILSEFG